MKVLLIRHAIAEDRDAFKKTGMADDLRPLTVEGRRKMRRAARGLARAVESIDLIVTSPLVRAVETAHVVAKAYPKVHVVELESLAPGGKPEAVLRFLVQQGKGAIALVGHEPDLGRLICAAIGCKSPDRLPLKKGGAALIDFDGPVTAGEGTLQLVLTPQVLRKLG